MQTFSQEIFTLFQALTSQQGDPDPAIIEAFQSAKYSLTMVITSLEERSALSEKDIIAPNQRFWPETAQQMDAKKALRHLLANKHGLTEHSLSAVKSKCKCLYNGPYAEESA